MHFPFETLFSFESGSTPLSNEVFKLHLILSRHLLNRINSIFHHFQLTPPRAVQTRTYSLSPTHYLPKSFRLVLAQILWRWQGQAQCLWSCRHWHGGRAGKVSAGRRGKCRGRCLLHKILPSHFAAAHLFQ